MANRTSHTVIQLNDSHAYFNLHQEMFWQGGHAIYRPVGGYARIATLVKQIRAGIQLYFQDPGSGQPAAHPAGLPIECSTGSVPMSSPLTRSSSRISPRRFREQKRLTPISHQVFGIRSGFQGMMAGSKGILPGIKVVAKMDFTKNIEKLDVVIPILHGDGQERNRAPPCSFHYQDGQKLCC